MKTTTKHFESMYLVLTDTGSLILVTYRPTDSYSGQKASDLPALYKVPYISNISHDLQVGQSISIFRNFDNMVHPESQDGIIVAKKQRYWDYSCPIGKREEVVSISEKWDENMRYYKKK
jgi:hypothetical protein